METIIELRDGEKPENKRKFIDLLSNAEDFIWLTNWYFKAEHIEVLTECLKKSQKVNEMRLILLIPASVADLNKLKEEFDLLQKQFSKISIKIKLIPRKLKQTLHDRYYYTKNQAWNFIEIDTLLIGQRATISQLKSEEFEKNVNQDFLRLWTDEKSFDMFEQWVELHDAVKIRQENLEKTYEDTKKRQKNANKQQTTFYVYKTINGVTIEGKDRVLIEIDEAIKELRTLEPGKSDGTSYIGFCNMSTNESLQFLRKSDDEWYGEVPIDSTEEWEGYAYKVFGTWDEMQKTLKSFFSEEPYRVLLPWKITRFKKWMPEISKRKEEQKRKEIFKGLE
jgi:hypothetical protein